MDNFILLLVAFSIMFLNSTFDWADGSLARATGQQSVFGEKLDCICGAIKQAGFIGMIAAVAFQRTDQFGFLYIGILSLFCLLVINVLPLIKSEVNIKSQSHEEVDMPCRRSRSARLLSEAKAISIYDGRSRYTDVVIALALLAPLVNFDLFLLFPLLWAIGLSLAAVKGLLSLPK